jgi:3-deoxy-manno-octulosonate cytidylyltransferase (CMP-KDO synthetase)
MKIFAFIPARFAATRFPGKLMKMLGEKPVIIHVYDAVANTGLFDDVIVVTDSLIIRDAVLEKGGHAVLSKREHESGSDRIAEVVQHKDVDIIVNVQGDEPFIRKEPLEQLVRLFDDPEVQVGSLMRKITAEEMENHNSVKVSVDKKGDAIYFSRRPGTSGTIFLHIGVYAYRKSALMSFTAWPQSPQELSQKLEQLRYLDNGVNIRMAETDYHNIAIDTPSDLQRAREMIGNPEKRGS